MITLGGAAKKSPLAAEPEQRWALQPEKKLAGLSVPAKQPPMKGEPMKKENSDLTPAQVAELEALAALPDDQINTRDIPEQRDWSKGIGAARHAAFFPTHQKAADPAP